jgi:hypothetical protein
VTDFEELLVIEVFVFEIWIVLAVNIDTNVSFAALEHLVEKPNKKQGTC